jgi:hypothetical protein
MNLIAFLSILVISVSQSPSFQYNTQSEKNIEAFEITQILPNVDFKGVVQTYDTSTTIVYYYKDMSLYRLSYFYSEENEGKTIIDHELRYHYVVCKKDSLYGYDYDQHKSPGKKRVLIDSAFAGEWAVQTKLYPMFEKNLPKLISTKKEATTLIENYKLRDKTDSVYIADFTLKYTNAIKNIDLSICKEFDSLKNMKLYELSFFANPYYMKRFGIIKGRYYSYYHLKKIPVENQEKILHYFIFKLD